MGNEEKRIGILKIVIISAGIAVAVAAALLVLYNFFKKHFKVTFDCGDCDECDEDCWDFDPLTDDDFAPDCDAIDDLDEEAEEEAAADDAEAEA